MDLHSITKSAKYYLNFRTGMVMALAIASTHLSLRYALRIHFDVVLFGLAVAFPLGTSIQTAFKRRERALEYLSVFRAGLMAIYYSFKVSEDFTQEQKDNGRNLLISASERLFEQLTRADGNARTFQFEMDKVLNFINDNKEGLSRRVQQRAIRYLKEAIEASSFLLSLIRHRTMAGLRFYALWFVNFYAIIQGPMVVYELSGQLPVWAIYLTSLLSAAILITLYNFQILIEFPFDQKGPDDIQLAEFKLNI